MGPIKEDKISTSEKEGDTDRWKKNKQHDRSTLLIYVTGKSRTVPLKALFFCTLKCRVEGSRGE